MQEKESPKKKNFLEKLQSPFSSEIGQEKIVIRFKKWKKEISELIEKLKTIGNLRENNFELGKKHYSLGNFDDAVMRFKFVTLLDQNYADAWYWLGRSYIANGKKPDAVNSLKKALAIKPNWPEAHEMLKVASS
jgi:tetratricopeptide (TPR) repeat protein